MYFHFWGIAIRRAGATFRKRTTGRAYSYFHRKQEETAKTTRRAFQFGIRQFESLNIRFDRVHTMHLSSR